MTTEKIMQAIIRDLKLVDLGDAGSYLERATSVDPHPTVQAINTVLPTFIQQQAFALKGKRDRALDMLMHTPGLVDFGDAGNYLKKASSRR